MYDNGFQLIQNLGNVKCKSNPILYSLTFNKGKLYRLLFNMNKDTETQVRIAVGQTNEKEHGENVG